MTDGMIPAIEGYLSTLSTVPGETIQLFASSNAGECSLTIVREGEPEEMVHEENGIAVGDHPIPERAWETGPGWPRCWELTIPETWRSGVYRVTLAAERAPNLETHSHWSKLCASHDILLVVRARKPASTSKILLQLTTNTYAAYNSWGGKSTYAYNSSDRDQGHRVSLLRPGHGYHNTAFFLWERSFVRWCDREGYALEYAVNHDLETWPDGFNDYRLILSVGHDEYWSSPMRDNLERFIGGGGNAAFFSGNSVCWQVRFEDDGKTMVTYKEHYKEDPLYTPEGHPLLATLFSHPLVNRPENYLTGVGFPMGGYHLSHDAYMDGPGEYTVKRADHWALEGTGLNEGDVFGAENTIVGYETDGCAYHEQNGYPVPTCDDGTPEDFVIICQAPSRWTGMEFDVYQEAGVSNDGRATMGSHTRGGTVFTAGTTDWAHGLKNDPIVQRITRNVLDRLSAD
ncbi:MAG TPA: hypothetical protein DIC52_02605 [Candidatus Latescibacteria bacterium]|nr:hypothetical protein [Candidatus Latescibacterota bacterium]